MIDYDLQSYWMGPPYRSDGVSNIDPLQADHITINLDIGQVYDAANIKVWFGFKPQMYDLFISVDGTNWEQREVTSGRTWGLIFLAQTENPIPVRYVRLYIIKAFRDEADPAQWGTSIRDFEVYRWRNLARNRTAEADSVWDYPVHRANDNDPDTAWVGRFGAPEAEVVLDLGEVKNIAGFHVSMGYIVSNVRFSSSYDGIQYTSRYVWQNMGMDDPKELGIDSSIHHFQCRYVKIHMWVPIDDQKHPDYYYDEELEEPMMSINEIQLLEHPGGGGIFGIQNLDGSQYSTLSFGLRQPGEYILASEQDLYTQDLGGGKPGDEGQLVHLVVSFAQTHTDAGTPGDVRRTMISVYRNGVYHGSRYEVDGPMSRLNQPNQTRLVFGIRSTTFTDASVADPGAGVVHGSTHSPFFGGKIHNATLFSNALAQDEVRGIYLAASGRGNESACQCYDACPMGENRHFPGVPVPCSGQGACVAGSAITGFVTGTCVCLQGFSGAACENHCSDLSKWGCCKVDDDCPSHLQCYTGVGACSCSISLNDCPEDRDCDVGGTNLCTLMKAT